MAKHADDSPAAILLQKQQSRRLQHLRRVLGVTRTTAAEMAGVSRFTWRRMEEGAARIDMVALRHFLAAYDRHPNLPGEYVLSGSTDGLPLLIAMNLMELDRQEPEDFGGGSTPPSGGTRAPSAAGTMGRPQHRRKGGNGTRQALATQVAA